MKKNKNILYLCECILLLLALLLIFTLYFSRLLSDPAVPAQKLHHLAQIPVVLLMLALVLAAIQRELLSRLLVNAFRDITEVHNKTSLEKKIQKLNDLPSTFQIGVMMFDLNNLKYVNDTYGHEKGDEFIQTFTYCLTRILDKNSFLARYGGDEFILIQKNTSLSALEQMEQRLSLLVQDYNHRADLPLSYAVGYEVSFPNHYFMMDDLINVADKKMYQDKSEKKKAMIKKQNRTLSHANPVIPTVSSEFLSEKIHQIQKNTANGHQIALISTDVENFHYINDKYGYPLGNEILNIVFEELSAAPFSLFTARFFSDVFINIADTSDLTQDALLAQIEQLNQRISLRIQETYQISFFRTNSGICFISDEQTAPESIVSCANVARRIAKKMISHSCIYSDEIDRDEKMRAEILHSFHSALECV